MANTFTRYRWNRLLLLLTKLCTAFQFFHFFKKRIQTKKRSFSLVLSPLHTYRSKIIKPYTEWNKATFSQIKSFFSLLFLSLVVNYRKSNENNRGYKKQTNCFHAIVVFQILSPWWKVIPTTATFSVLTRDAQKFLGTFQLNPKVYVSNISQFLSS